MSEHANEILNLHTEYKISKNEIYFVINWKSEIERKREREKEIIIKKWFSREIHHQFMKIVLS